MAWWSTTPTLLPVCGRTSSPKPIRTRRSSHACHARRRCLLSRLSTWGGNDFEIGLQPIVGDLEIRGIIQHAVEGSDTEPYLTAKRCQQAKVAFVQISVLRWQQSQVVEADRCD